MTDQTQQPAPATSRELVHHPATGEVLDLADATTTELAAAAGRALADVDEILAFRQKIVDEVAGRMDRENTRTAVVGNLKLTTNAPTTETYPVPLVRAALVELSTGDDAPLEPGVVDRVIDHPPPKPQDPVVRKAELNKLKAHPDPRVPMALLRAMTRNPQRRTLKVEIREDKRA